MGSTTGEIGEKAPLPLKPVKKTSSSPHPPADDGMTSLEEQQVLAAARRVLAGDCERVELYRNRGKLVVREVRFSEDEG